MFCVLDTAILLVDMATALTKQILLAKRPRQMSRQTFFLNNVTYLFSMLVMMPRSRVMTPTLSCCRISPRPVNPKHFMTMKNKNCSPLKQQSNASVCLAELTFSSNLGLA